MRYGNDPSLIERIIDHIYASISARWGLCLLNVYDVIDQLIMALIVAIPIRFAWNCIASSYFVNRLPENMMSIPYLHIVAAIVIINYLIKIIQAITPKFK